MISRLGKLGVNPQTVVNDDIAFEKARIGA